MIRFQTEGETPAKKNSKVMNTKTHRLFPSPKYREWHDLNVAVITQQKRLEGEKFPIDDPVRIVLEFNHSDNRRRDSDNGTSSILDLLVDCGILSDDCWQIVQELEIRNRKEKNSFCKIYVDKIK